MKNARACWLATLSLALVLGLPARSAAETPLRTWCTSPTMDYCMGIHAFEFAAAVEPSTPLFSFVTATIFADFFGALVEPDGNLFIEAWLDIETVEFGTYAIPLAGLQQNGVVVEGGAYDGTVVRNSTIDDIRLIAFGSARPCGIGEPYVAVAGQECYLVPIPEPPVALLVLAGLVGMAAMRRRLSSAY